MAKTLIDVDRDLVEQARKILGQPSMVATIREALARVVRENDRSEFFSEMANLDDDERAAMRAAR